MAETWTRMDHLEKAVLEVKHEDLLNGVLVRLDHMHDMIKEAEVGAADAAAHRQEQLKFKDMVRHRSLQAGSVGWHASDLSNNSLVDAWTPRSRRAHVSLCLTVSCTAQHGVI